jgi:Flp pilus assembly protein TadD
MCRKLLLAATAVISFGAVPMGAFAAKTNQAALAAPANPASAPRKAAAAERTQADRLDPLTRSAFWAREVNLDPSDAVAGVHLAAALRALGQYTEAARAAQQVLVFDPKNPDALMETARAFIAAGQGFYAIDPLKQVIGLAPRDWRPLSLVGVAYVQVQRNDDAQSAWTQALALSPDNPAVLSNIAMALAAQGRAPEAESLLRRAIVQPGASLQERQNLTLVLGLQGKLAEAEKLLREDLPPQQADANLAYLQAASSHPEAAAAPTADPDRTWNRLKAAGG